MLFGSLWIMCVMVVVAFVRPVWFGRVVCAGLAQELELRSLASTSIDARFFSWELDGQIPCHLYSIDDSRCCRQHCARGFVCMAGSTTPTVVTSPVGCPRFSVSQAVSSGLVPEVEMTDRRDWGGGGEDPEESTQHMIERIWESLTDIQMRMDQQAPVPPATVPPDAGVPVAPVVPPPRVEVPYVAPVPPPLVMVAEEPVMQVEKFLRLQPPTYTGGPNPDTAEHWIHEIEKVFTTMRCPTADKVVLATYQLRGFAQQWWRLKMQTTFVGRTEEGLREELQNAVIPLMCRSVEEAAQRAATLERSIRARQASGSGSGSFWLPQQGDLQTSTLRRRCPGPSRLGRDGTIRRVLNRKCSLNPAGQNRAQHALFGQGEVLHGFSGAFRRGSLRFGMFSPREAHVEREKRRGIAILRVLRRGRVV
ncbi:hypothetical protein Taro_046168 [Colocasia esculenta]|uniref:Retrotransposon gag domain-containing protein n=1 Tax=Colocasia esculenta TaxID=4460 RepID=A0A843WYN2_COLES|nr:hypothetical protein [Colocasia esculenta]